jgi:hypothetical protein
VFFGVLVFTAHMPRGRKIKEIRANRLVIEDPSGQVRAEINASLSDMVFFQMYHGERPVLAADVDPKGDPHITFYNKDGQAVLGVGVSEEFGQGLTINDSQGRPVCFVFVAPDGIPRIRLFQVTRPDSAERIWSSPDPAKNE